MTAMSDQAQAKAQRTVISVDAMGGDQGPAIVVAGCAESAAKNPDISFVLHGPAEGLDLGGTRVSFGAYSIEPGAVVLATGFSPSHEQWTLPAAAPGRKNMWLVGFDNGRALIPLLQIGREARRVASEILRNADRCSSNYYS